MEQERGLSPLTTILRLQGGGGDIIKGQLSLQISIIFVVVVDDVCVRAINWSSSNLLLPSNNCGRRICRMRMECKADLVWTTWWSNSRRPLCMAGRPPCMAGRPLHCRETTVHCRETFEDCKWESWAECEEGTWRSWTWEKA